jgi:hypothetical protein
MKPRQLTKPDRAATSFGMKRSRSWSGWPKQFRFDRTKGLMLVGSALVLTGCISVNAPDKPIVIELNINITQEVVYRLAADAGNTIKDNPGIF